MTNSLEIPHHIMCETILEVYDLAHSLYLMSGGEVPEGCDFSRSIDAMSEYCYNAAAVAYYNHIRNQLH
jgi:hypothetical protein